MELFNPKKQILVYIGDVFLGDVNSIAKDRKLDEGLKSEQTTATSDQFTFDISWKQFKELAAIRFEDDPNTLLKPIKTRVIFIEGDYIRFSGYLASEPARTGYGAQQTLSLTFYETFTRLSGDVVCDPNNIMSPLRKFSNRPAHLFVQDLINEYMARAANAGEALNWSFGNVATLANKTITYMDFQAVSKALCDAMNNVEGAGKFDIVFRADSEDYSHQIIDILAPRGKDKNIIIKYPGDGVYKLWSTDYSTEEVNDYASDVLVSGNGEVGDPAKGEMTAKLGAASNSDFVSEYGYWRVYDTQSNLESQQAVQDYANTIIKQKNLGLQTPEIKLIGRPIEWGNVDNPDNGLSIGDTFYFEDGSDGGENQSGKVRIISMNTSWDNTGVATVLPVLKRAEN